VHQILLKPIEFQIQSEEHVTFHLKHSFGGAVIYLSLLSENKFLGARSSFQA